MTRTDDIERKMSQHRRDKHLDEAENLLGQTIESMAEGELLMARAAVHARMAHVYHLKGTSR